MRSLSTRLRVFAFLVAVGGFVTANVLGMLALRGIDEDATSIAGNAVPSVLHLSHIRTMLIRIDGRLITAMQDPSHSAIEKQVSELEADRRQLVDTWRLYKQNPAYRFERPLWPAVERAMAELDRNLDEFVSRARRDANPQALADLRGNIRTLSNDMTARLIELTDYNVEQARARAQDIQKTRHRHLVTVVALNALALVFAVVTFVTAHRRIRSREQELERRVGELDEFAGRAAHDLTSPLSTANLALDAVASSPTASPGLARMAERGKSGIARAQQVVQSLLAFARSGARPSPGVHADSVEVIRTMIEEFRPVTSLQNIELTSDIREDAAELNVRCDAVLLAVVLRNLVQNAVKYMPEDGTRRITLRALAVPPWVRLEVEDTGKGVPHELRERVFEPYHRGQQRTGPGIGLGLATVRRIVEAHGGRVSIDGGPGAVFQVDLPRAQPATEDAEVPSWRRIARRLGVRTS